MYRVVFLAYACVCVWVGGGVWGGGGRGASVYSLIRKDFHRIFSEFDSGEILGWAHSQHNGLTLLKSVSYISKYSFDRDALHLCHQMRQIDAGFTPA